MTSSESPTHPDAPRAGGETPSEATLAEIRKGVEDARDGRVVDRGSFAAHASETPEARATNYALAFDLLKVAGWIAAHTLRGETADEQFAILYRAVSHLRGESREPVQRLDELLRNDPWAAAIASHVQASLLERHRDGERDTVCGMRFVVDRTIPPGEIHMRQDGRVVARLINVTDGEVAVGSAGPSPERASK